MKKADRIYMWVDEFVKVEKIVQELIFDMYANEETKMASELNSIARELSQFRRKRLYGGDN